MPDAKQNMTDAVSGASLDDFVDRTELARRLKVHERTIRRMVERGELPRPCLGGGGRPRWLWCYVLEHCQRHHEKTAKSDRKLRSQLNL